MKLLKNRELSIVLAGVIAFILLTKFYEEKSVIGIVIRVSEDIAKATWSDALLYQYHFAVVLSTEVID